MLKSPNPSATDSGELFIFPPPISRQHSISSGPPSPRSGILKPGSSANGRFRSPSIIWKSDMDVGANLSPNFPRKQVRHSIISVDSTYDVSGLSLPLSPRKRCQRKLSVYLHTHVVLIIVCSLAILDAVCVIGQLISDILIMQEKLSYFEKIDEDLTKELLPRLPEINQSIHDNWNLHAILTVLQGTDIHSRVVRQVLDDSLNFSQVNDISEVLSLDTPYMTGHHRVRRSIEPKVPGHEVDHGALYELTHACHLGSMAILSLLLLETLLKVFAMGKKLKDHKLEIFDALIVTISWCLDVGLWEGIWAHPGTQAATFLMYLLPWRVIRLVNSKAQINDI